MTIAILMPWEKIKRDGCLCHYTQLPRKTTRYWWCINKSSETVQLRNLKISSLARGDDFSSQ